MLIIISSAKTQHYAPLADLPVCQPPLLEQANILADHCRRLNRQEIMKIMKVSEKLGESTYQRFQNFSAPHHEKSASPALSTFAGDVFSEIDHLNFTRDDYLYAHERLRILSGLYGILQPLDLMQSYRLEMGYKISVGNAANLYDYWAESITEQLNRDLKETAGTIIINCASKEYSRAVLSKQLDGSMLTMTFKQRKNDKIRSIAIYAKRARGMFVDWFISNRILEKGQLKEFDRGGYQFCEDLSAATEFVFITDLKP